MWLGLTLCQPLWVILCPLPEKGRKEIEEIVEEIKERDREERGTGMKGQNQKKLEMYQYDTDAPAQSHPQPHAGILQKMEVERRDQSIFFKTRGSRATGRSPE